MPPDVTSAETLWFELDKDAAVFVVVGVVFETSVADVVLDAIGCVSSGA